MKEIEIPIWFIIFYTLILPVIAFVVYYRKDLTTIYYSYYAHWKKKGWVYRLLYKFLNYFREK
jgi:hypothetical protein